MLFDKEMKRVNLFVPMDSEVVEGTRKKTESSRKETVSKKRAVLVLLMDTGVAIHMMVEKKYPLTQERFSRMLSRRLEVDHESEMAFELLRFTKLQLQK
ncbi:hypothetical protein Tco_1342068 [Tanacetum coccineum]